MNNKLIKLYLVTLVLNLGVALVFGYASPVTTYHADSEFLLLKLISTHFSHHNLQHLFGNMLALLLLLYLFPNKSKTLIYAFFVCIIMTALYAKSINVNIYLGFSALLYCVPGAYFCLLVKDNKITEAVSILMILFVYLYMISPMKLEINQAWVPMTTAHLIGFVCGYWVQCLTNRGSTTDVKTEHSSLPINP